MLVKAAGTVRV